MALSFEDHWVWDSWYYPEKVDGLWHAYYLTAPKNDIDPELRHSDARIGHSTSPDLITWTHRGIVINPGAAGTWNDRAIWTGCLVKSGDGVLHNFYTSTNESSEKGLIQRIGSAVGTTFDDFVKTPLALEADPKLYERLDPANLEQSKHDNGWKEEAWRDPWVFFDARDNLWHMLVTARSIGGLSKNRGTVGHLTSKDLVDWQVLPPLTGKTAFAHLEVLQVVETSSGWIVVFSTGKGDIDPRSGIRQVTGTYSAPADSPTGPYHFGQAELVDDGTRYAGRVLQDTDGTFKLLGFQNGGESGFTGVILDPATLTVTERRTFKQI